MISPADHSPPPNRATQSAISASSIRRNSSGRCATRVPRGRPGLPILQLACRGRASRGVTRPPHYMGHIHMGHIGELRFGDRTGGYAAGSWPSRQEFAELCSTHTYRRELAGASSASHSGKHPLLPRTQSARLLIALFCFARIPFRPRLAYSAQFMLRRPRLNSRRLTASSGIGVMAMRCLARACAFRSLREHRPSPPPDNSGGIQV
jgi:hypothetical protein